MKGIVVEKGWGNVGKAPPGVPALGIVGVVAKEMAGVREVKVISVVRLVKAVVVLKNKEVLSIIFWGEKFEGFE